MVYVLDSFNLKIMKKGLNIKKSDKFIVYLFWEIKKEIIIYKYVYYIFKLSI